MPKVFNSEEERRAWFATIGRKGGLQTKKLLDEDPDYYSKIGLAGGNKIKAMYGKKYFSQAGKKGWEARRAKYGNEEISGQMRSARSSRVVVRKPQVAAGVAGKDTCSHGHPLSGENLIYNNRGTRVCLECKRRVARESQQRRRIARSILRRQEAA